MARGIGAPVLICAAFLLAGCGSDPDGGYRQYFQAARQGFGGGQQQALRREAAAISQASMGYRVGDGEEAMLVLASGDNDGLLWTAKSHVVILSHDGRILRTVGLPHDVTSVTPQTGQSLPAPADALASPFSSKRVADFPDISAYGVALACFASAAGPETIAVLGTARRTVRVRESCHSDRLDWSFADDFWIDPQTRLVWRSIQHIHPREDPVETEIFHPPG